MRGFGDWLCAWEKESSSSNKCGLSKETFGCAKQSSGVLACLYEHLLHEEHFDFVLPGKCQSDKLECKFGKYRQLNGGNLYASVRQFLEANRNEKILNLSKLKLQLKDIKELFSEENETAVIENSALEILCCLLYEDSIDLTPIVPDAELNVLFYVAGCFSRNLVRQTDCCSCKNLLLAFENSVNESKNEPHLTLFNNVNRGGLTLPSELIFLLSIQAWHFYHLIFLQPCLKQFITSETYKSQQVFVKAFTMYLNEFDETRSLFINRTCKNSHHFEDFVVKFTKKMFNVFAKNLVSKFNSDIHSTKIDKKMNQKRVKHSLKVTKLQSESL